MEAAMLRPATIWMLAVVAFGSFTSWYTGFGAPLTPDEIDQYLARIELAGETDTESLARLRTFLEEDTGRDFVMVNSILMRDQPLREEGVGPDESSQQVLDRYMAYMWPALLRRACHPVLAGAAVAPALDHWGIEGGERWSSAGLMRYRSRRDLMEIAATPEFNGPHGFKIAAMEKTIAFPVETMIDLGDPRLLLGLLLFSLASAYHLLALLLRRPPTSPTGVPAPPKPPPGWDTGAGPP